MSETAIRKVFHKCSALISEQTKKKIIERLSADLQSRKIRYIFGLITWVEKTAPSTFAHNFGSRINCWTISRDDFRAIMPLV